MSNIEAAVERYNYSHRKVGAGTHYYRLKITNANNSVVYSSIKKINVTHTDNKYITIYPNPATDKIFITANSISEATIMDASGKQLKTFKNINTSQLQINIEQFTAGVYYIKLVQKNKLTLHKFVVKK